MQVTAAAFAVATFVTPAGDPCWRFLPGSLRAIFSPDFCLPSPCPGVPCWLEGDPCFWGSGERGAWDGSACAALLPAHCPASARAALMLCTGAELAGSVVLWGSSGSMLPNPTTAHGRSAGEVGVQARGAWPGSEPEAMLHAAGSMSIEP